MTFEVIFLFKYKLLFAIFKLTKPSTEFKFSFHKEYHKSFLSHKIKPLGPLKIGKTAIVCL